MILIFISRKAKPARCGESSAEGGFPSAGDWRTRRGVSPVVATGAQRREEDVYLNTLLGDYKSWLHETLPASAFKNLIFN